MKSKKVIINGVEKEALWVEKQGHWDAHWEVDGVQFEGHHVRWGFSYTPKTYLKESELSGDEWRKGGTIKYFKDEIQVYEQFCREPEYATKKVMETLSKLMELDWEKVKEGTKIYYENTPALIGYIMLDQGTFMVETDGVERFPRPAYSYSEGGFGDYEEPNKLKVDILSPHIYWYRK